MVYTNEVPWHSLGHKVTQAKTVAEMIKLSKTDWTVSKQPLYLDGAKDPISEAFALMRSRDKAILDVVGPAYTPVQNVEGFEFFNEYIKAGSAEMDTMGSLRGGKYVWGLANLKAGFKLAGRDEVKGYLLVAIPHQQGKSFVIKITTIRVVCMNTLMLALRKGGDEFRMVHRRVFDKHVMEEAKQTLGIARDQIKEFGEVANHLKKMKMSKDKAFETFALVYAPGDKFTMEDAPEKVKRVMDIYENAPGADPGTGWGVLNAVTYYADHVASRTADKRLTNAWFGKTGAQKERVLELLKVRA
jgi:phage/plasmid-like protein (TIGR03299 family)